MAFATSIFFVAANAANAACYPSGQEMPADQVNAFLTDPATLLANNPSGGEGLIAKVRDLVASSPDALQPVLGLLKDANAEQKTGIGNGLNQAAGVCLPGDQAFATEIQRQLAATGDKEAMLAYTTGKWRNGHGRYWWRRCWRRRWRWSHDTTTNHRRRRLRRRAGKWRHQYDFRRIYSPAMSAELPFSPQAPSSPNEREYREVKRCCSRSTE